VPDFGEIAKSYFSEQDNPPESLPNTAHELSSSATEVTQLSTLTVSGINKGGILADAATEVVTAASIQKAADDLAGLGQAAISTAKDFLSSTTDLISNVKEELLATGADAQAVDQITSELADEAQDITQQISANGGDSQAIHQGLSSFVDAAGKILDNSAQEFATALDDLENAYASGDFSKEETIAWHKLIGYSSGMLAMDGFVVSFGGACSLVAKLKNSDSDEEDLATKQAKNRLHHSINSLGTYGKWSFNLTKEESINVS
jgi:hypothetical protein